MPSYVQSTYFARLFNAASRYVNVLLLSGDPTESISSRAWRSGWTRTVRVINACFWWQNNHCRGAYNKEVAAARAYIALAPTKHSD